MPGKKGKKSTPPELDFLFERALVEEDEYRDFWSRWWKAGKIEREDIIEKYLEEESEEEPETPLTGSITKVRATAEFQAKLMGGRVVRRNKKMQFSKRGIYYQAILGRRK